MVNRLVLPLVMISLLWTLVTTATASEALSVEPDRKRLYEGEVLTLTVKGTMEIDIRLSNLFDFDTSSLPKPDIEKVEDNFEILGQNQRYSIQTVNGKMMGEVVWTYQLTPRKQGQLTIPPLTFRDAKSEPVTIEVVDGNPPDQGNGPRDSFIELSADKDSVYVQEQLILSVKLFFNGNMVRGELSEPSHPNAIIESLGKQTEYTRYRDGIRYRVVERRYAIFPQKAGELTLPPIRFEGQTRDSSGRLKFLRDSKQLFTLPVADVPAEFTGKTWLPAKDLTLSESGLPNNPVIDAGQNLSRSLSVVAEGLPAAALPPFSHETPNGLRAYPENPERTTVPTEAGLTARLTQTSALVPVAAGELTLPEIRIPWWDTETDSQKFAVIPSRTLQVQAVPGQSTVSTAQPDDPAQATQAEEEQNASEAADESGWGGLWIWQTIALVLLAGWMITGFCWWYSKRSKAGAAEPLNRSDESEKALFTTLCESARAGAPETPDHLVRWVQHLQPDRPVTGLQDTYRLLGNDQIEQKIRHLQALAYSQEGGAAESWRGGPLVEALSECREKLTTGPVGRSPLPPLYPSELAASKTY